MTHSLEELRERRTQAMRAALDFIRIAHRHTDGDLDSEMQIGCIVFKPSDSKLTLAGFLTATCRSMLAEIEWSRARIAALEAEVALYAGLGLKPGVANAQDKPSN